MSTTKFFRKVYNGTQENQRLQSNIEDSITGLLQNALLSGRLVESVNLVSGDNKLEHKLGRKIRGYIFVKKSGAADIYNSSDDELFLTLNSSANITASIWIF